MRGARAIGVALVAAAASAAEGSPATATAPPTSETCEVSFATARVPAGARVIALSLELRGGWVVGIVGIPRNWSVEVSTDVAFCPRVRCSARQAADAIAGPTKLPLRVTVERPAGGPPLPLVARGSIRTTSDFVASASRAFAVPEMTVRCAPAAPAAAAR